MDDTVAVLDIGGDSFLGISPSVVSDLKDRLSFSGLNDGGCVVQWDGTRLIMTEHQMSIMADWLRFRCTLT